jgi:5-methyltetrahydrofolate--homocysteine methyltransferase
VVLATVQGDIHDIGKNIVALMLNNYNFEVIDLGKDVGAEDIIRAAKHHGADIIGLSALMTTTMVEMKKVIDLARAEDLSHVRFMIGGAVVDQHYAEEIGANGYAGDAIGAVRWPNNSALSRHSLRCRIPTKRTIKMHKILKTGLRSDC